MTSETKKRFTVITNHELEYREQYKHKNYQTNPLQEQFMRFVNNESGRRFSVEDLLKW